MSGLREAYARLADGQSLELPATDLLEIERAGFVGLRLEDGIVRAWKGKDGPCWETGRSATYRGAAAAALDDDRHLLFGTMRLCEKTARVYRFPPYAGWVDVTEPDPAASGPFDCNTFEADAAKLAETLPTSPAGERTSVFYPGPFKLLILHDGSIVRRGQAVAVPRAQAELLLQRGEVLPAEKGVEAPLYPAAYAERGALCLLGELMEGTSTPPAREPDLQSLIDAAEPLRRRLLRLIERGDAYFLLVGSDPADAEGCCPSDDVGRANALVKAGVLESWTASAEASCPSTVYAFSGEIVRRGEPPAFSRNEALRARIAGLIRTKAGIPGKLALRLALFALMAAGVGLALWRLLRDL